VKFFLDCYFRFDNYAEAMMKHENLPIGFPDIPEMRESPWLKPIIELFNKQSQMIQEQAQVIQAQAEQINALKEEVRQLKDEITRLKKNPKRPKFRPPGGSKNKNSESTHSSKSTLTFYKTPLKQQQEVHICLDNVPQGFRFKGYASYTVQELEIIPKDIVYKLEMWEGPDGSILQAKLPKGVQGTHFGSELLALVHNLYAFGMTEPGLFDLLRGLGIDISEGQVHNILMKESAKYQALSEQILKAGLGVAPYIRVDDTGAKHQHKSGVCTHIGGEFFAYYRTTSSKSRKNFLKILLQGKEEYWINEAFIWHLYECGAEDDLLNCFEEIKGKRYRRKKGLMRLLDDWGIGNKKLREQCLEAGLIGFISETILCKDQILLSDRAGQFAILNHAACWIHMERPLRKLKVTCVEVEESLKQVREAIWVLYDKVKEASWTQTGKEEVRELYDELVEIKSISPEINEVIASFKKYREEMLKALDYPKLPLHNNDSERDIRGIVKRRNISGSTKSEEGKVFRDGLMTLKQTCFRLGVSFFGFMKEWFGRDPVNLADLVVEKYRTQNAIA
jgi:cell division protein FtsB